MKIKIPELVFFQMVCVPFSLFSQNEGNTIFFSNKIHDVHLNFSQTAFWDSLTYYYTLDQDMQCDMVFNGDTVKSVGAKFKGNSSYKNSGDKKSFKIDLNEFVTGLTYDGLKKFNLNNCFKDPTFMREKLMLDFCYRNNIPAPRCTYARVYLNNVYWGLYTLVEEVNKTFLEQRFADKTGNLFKGDPTGDLKWMGAADSSYYKKYELHTNELINDWSDLVHLIDEINNTPSGNFRDSLEAVFNVPAYLYAWAASNIFANLDSYMGSGHNYFVYHNTTTGKFEWVTWDVNEAFANFQMGMNITQLENLSMFFISSPQSNRPLNQKIIQNIQLKQGLADAVCDLLSKDFSPEILNPVIDSIANVIRTDVYADTNKFYTNQQFENNINMNITIPGNPGGGTIPGLKSFIPNRRNALKQELLSYGCNVGMDENEIAKKFNSGRIFSDEISIFFPGITIIDASGFRIFDIAGKDVSSSFYLGVDKETDGFLLTIRAFDICTGIYIIKHGETAVPPLFLLKISDR